MPPDGPATGDRGAGFTARTMVKFYNGRSTGEQWIKEGKDAVKWTRLSCHDFAHTQVRLQLFALACNLGTFLRRLALPRSVKPWSLTTLREQLITIGAQVVAHSRHVVFQMAEVAVPKRLFRALLERIRWLRLPETVPGGQRGRPSHSGTGHATVTVCVDRQCTPLDRPFRGPP